MAQAMNPGDELVDVVDELGKPIAVVTRREMRAKRLPHRSVYILVFNSRDEIFIHLRTPTKDIFPSHWDMTVGGVPNAGESFEESARREVFEELGIKADPTPIFPFKYEDARVQVHGQVYFLRHDGPFHLQAEEIVRGEFIDPHLLQERMDQEPFCPDGIMVWLRYCAFKKEKP